MGCQLVDVCSRCNNRYDSRILGSKGSDSTKLSKLDCLSQTVRLGLREFEAILISVFHLSGNPDATGGSQDRNIRRVDF